MICVSNHDRTWPLSLVFVVKIISTFIGQNPKFFFMHVLIEGYSASLTAAYEKQTRNSFYLSWS